MISEDPVSTTISFDGNPSTIITHKSSTIADEFGSRSLTMVFSGDNKAYAKIQAAQSLAFIHHNKGN